MRLADIEIGERYLWSAPAPTEVEAVDIVRAQRFSVRRGAAALTNERRVVVRNLANGVTRTIAARHLHPAPAGRPLVGAVSGSRPG